MRTLASIFGALFVLTISSLPGQAASYNATSYSNNAGAHSFWAPTLDNAIGGTASSDWDFIPAGTFTWNVGPGTATLTGHLVNDSDGGKQMDLTLNLTYRGQGAAGMGPTSGPKCEIATCEDPGNSGNVNPGSVYDTTANADPFVDWQYFEVAAGSKLEGTNDLAGLVLNLTQRPGPGEFPFQLGNCANNKDCDYGASVWLTWTLDTQASTGSWANLYPKYGKSDINIDLNPVPVPAAVWLFASALLGLFGVARVRSAA